MTPDGQPDLQGNWTTATLTPFQRPAQLAGKAFFSPEEAAAFERQRVQQNDVDRPEGPRDLARSAYNSVWFEWGTKVAKTRRTSLIVEPADGRIPALTPEARQAHERFLEHSALHPADGPEDRWLTERCVLFGAAGPPMLPEPYNSNYQILQGPGYVAILVEMNHEIRMIPLDDRPRPSPQLRQWTGYSRGHWEANTLIVETNNFKYNGQSRFGVAYLDGMSDANLRITERFTRTDPQTIIYRATIDDPTVFTTPWSVEVPFNKRREPLYEYACHEGNYGLDGILSGARAEERKQHQ
jgi:hypothetical protein